jgi:hypothetical protein
MADIVSKVEKLVAMSSSPHLEEARTSSYIACKLIRDYGLKIVFASKFDEKANSNQNDSSLDSFRPIKVKHKGYCIHCGKDILAGERALWRKGDGLLHFYCKVAFTA